MTIRSTQPSVVARAQSAAIGRWRTGPVLRPLVLTVAAWLMAFGLFTFGLCRDARALDVPPLQGRVNDAAGVLQPAEREALEQRLRAFESQTQHQFALLTLPTLDGEAIEDFGIRVAEAWKLGAKGKDDGLILLVAVQERRVRIEVGYGLEGEIPDALAGRVIRDVITPRFREGHHAEGINLAFDVLMKAAGGTGVELRDVAQPQAGQGGNGPGPGMIIFLVVLFILFTGGFRGFGGFVVGQAIGGMLGGSRGYRGGGGGGFSGRGGGFGGGGASGNW